MPSRGRNSSNKTARNHSANWQFMQAGDCNKESRVTTTDEQLMSAAAEGDMDAFEVLVRRHQQGVLTVALRLLGDEHRAQDAAQEAFLRVLESAPRYRPTASFRTYLYRILTRLCIDQYRRREPITHSELDSVSDDAETAPEALMRRERAEQVRQAIERLPARQRAALVLQHYEDMSYEEIGAVMKCSASSVDALLVRAKKKLRKWLSGTL